MKTKTSSSNRHSQMEMQEFQGNVSILHADHKMTLPNTTTEVSSILIFQWVRLARSHKWTELTVCCSWTMLPILSITTVARRHLSTNGIWASIRCCAVVSSQPVRSRSLWRWIDSGLQKTTVLFQSWLFTFFEVAFKKNVKKRNPRISSLRIHTILYKNGSFLHIVYAMALVVA